METKVTVEETTLNVNVTVSNERGPVAEGGGDWGDIGGTITDQTDLVSYIGTRLASGEATAKNVEVFVRNVTGATIAKGSIVYINDASGNRPTIAKAQANNDANSAQTIGFVKADIANNATGYVITSGDLENIDTQALEAGQQLYLSPTTAGAWTTTKPSAPQHLVYVGIVVSAHPTQGIIYVSIQNGYELDELHNVAITSPSTGQVLRYNETTGLWANQTLATSSGGNGTLDAGKFSVFGADGNLSASTTTGAALSATSTSGVSVYGLSDTGVGGDFTTANGINHAEFGLFDDDRSFVARVLGAFGWFRGLFTGRIQAATTLTGNRTWTLPDQSGTISLTSHTHGNLSSTGAIGTTAGVPIITGTSGVLQAGAFGNSAGTFTQGNDSRLSDERVPTGAGLTSKFGTTKGSPVNLDQVAILDSSNANAPRSVFAGSLGSLLVSATNIGNAIIASPEDTTPLDADQLPMTETAASGALRRLTFANLFAFVRAQLGLMTGAVQAAGEWAFQSATRPTSAGTGTPAANSLITRADGDVRYPRLILAMATAVQDVTNSSTLTPSTFLTATLETGTYRIETLELVGSSAFATAGSKADLEFTGTGTFVGIRLRAVASSVEPINQFLSWGGTGETINGQTTGPAHSLITSRMGTLIVTAPGTLRVRFAQNTAIAAQFARLHVGSYLRAEKIA